MAKQEKSAAELYREERKARLAKAAKQNSKGKKSLSVGKRGQSVISIVVVAAIIIGIVSIVLNSFGIFNRGKNIMKVGGAEVDQYEVVYYASQEYQMYAQYAMYGYLDGFEWDVQPDEQAYPGEIEGIENPTYADFFISSAKEYLRAIKASVAYAAKNGITLDSSEVASVQSQITQMKQTAATYGYGYPNFLRSQYGYGKGMTPDLFEKILTEAAIYNKVNTVVREEFEKDYTDEKLEEIYLDEITSFGVVSYRVYNVKATAPEKDADLDFDAAKATAEALAAAEDEAAFLLAVSELEKAAENEKYADYITDNALTLKEDVTYASLSTAGNVSVEEEAAPEAEEGEDNEEDKKEEEKLSVRDWLFDEERKAGDTCIAEKTATGYTVYMVHEAVHKIDTSYTYDVRHILLQFPKEEEKKEETAENAETAEGEETADKAETAPETEAETEEVRTPELLDATKYEGAKIYIDVDLETTKDPQLYMEAQDILIKYLEGDMTEEAFGELAKEYSSDGNAAEGGIYEAVTEGKMVAPFENWALAEGRKEGDVGIVETEFGYHIMYFIAKDEASSWSSVIKEEKVNADVTEFNEELLEANTIENYKAKYEKTIKKELKETARVTKNNLSAYY